ncbi:MAG: winged helix-turn-helix domain-containing protein [Pseudomonadota bacterium]
MKYRFEDFELNTETLELCQGGVGVPIEPQVFALLELLVSNADRAISKAEIHDRVWGGRVVSEAALDSRIRSARQAIGDSGKAQRLIRTVRGFGFRFVAAVARPGVVEVVAPFRQPEAEPAQAAGAAGSRKPAIAVLPLTLLSLDTRYEPLADAIAHELIADLSRLRWLHVISQASTFKLRGREAEIADVATVLGVDYVLTGTLSLFGESARVGVELNDARAGAIVWAEQITIELAELLDLRNQLVKQISNAIELRIQNQEADNIERIATENLDAWMCYFRGLRHVNRFNAHDNAIAVHLFQQALDQDPGFALAHAGLSFAHFQNAFVGYTGQADDSQHLALASAERAFDLDPLDPVVNLMVGRAEYLNGRWEQAEPWFDRVVKLNPNSAPAYYNKALVHAVIGRKDDIPGLSEQAMSLSPIDPLQYAFLVVRSIAHLTAGDHEAARRWGERAANAPLAHHLIDLIAAVCNFQAGDLEQARFRRDRARARSPDFVRADFFRSLPVRDAGLIRAVNEAFDALGVA